jgi:hypothetical protein
VNGDDPATCHRLLLAGQPNSANEAINTGHHCKGDDGRQQQQRCRRLPSTTPLVVAIVSMFHTVPHTHNDCSSQQLTRHATPTRGQQLL